MGRHRAHRLAHLGERGHGRWVIALDKCLEFFGGTLATRTEVADRRPLRPDLAPSGLVARENDDGERGDGHLHDECADRQQPDFMLCVPVHILSTLVILGTFQPGEAVAWRRL